ncbi:MAG: hypothetical protein CBB69_002420 [Phycisphaera sp. TMED9]|nr:MAG: hypothetical protein CBB69_010775 [Phycisphaera sp. TMED9]RPG20930.1 MAG: hypothetical protein CBB69_002420 [Phycisphaera sp. TMED9]
MLEASRRSPIVDAEVFGRAEGRELMDAAAVVLKGGLESEVDVAGLLVDVGGAFDRLLAASDDPAIARVLHRHRFAFLSRRSPERRLVEAGRLANRGAAIAVVDTREIPRAVSAIGRGGDAARRGLVVLAIDDPEIASGTPARSLFAGLDIPVLEIGDLDDLRLKIEHAARLADASDGPAAIIIDASLFRIAVTISVRANRVVETVDTAAALRRRRGPRFAVDRDLGRLGRRLELDVAVAMPSPGERETIGIIATGLASTSVRHVLEETRLTGRIPTVHVGLVHPLDPASIERLLTRCRTVLVVETRPGLLAAPVIEIAERLRRRGETVAQVAWRQVPGPGDSTLERGDAGHPSTLVHKLRDLLLEMRPTLEFSDHAEHELPDQPERPSIPPRPGQVGRGLLQSVRRAAVSADRTLRRLDDDATEPVALAINGRPPAGFSGRVVAVEIVERRRLLEEAVLLAAGRDGGRPWVTLIADEGWSDELDAARLLAAAIPAAGENPARVQVLEIEDDPSLRRGIEEAARATFPSVLVIRRREVTSVRDPNEIDRLGYAPLIRVKTRIDDACGVRPSGEPTVDPSLPRPDEVTGRYRFEPIRSRFKRSFVLRVGRLLEISELVRQRNPLPAMPVPPELGIAAPTPRHRGSGRWRAHIAGVRGTSPGGAGSLISLAGRNMGFDVRLAALAQPLAPGRTAWTQILFTRPMREDAADTLVPSIPRGEADVLIGIDPFETLRALVSDPMLQIATPGATSIIANTEPAVEEGPISPELRELLEMEAGRRCGTAEDRVEAFSKQVLQQFGNRRLLDIVLVGVAYQQGLIPVSLEAITEAAQRLERVGFGRSGEAFRFGRLLASRPLDQRAAKVPGVEPIGRRRREIVLETRLHRGTTSAIWLDERIGRLLESVPGLLETEAGRIAFDDIQLAVASLFRRGGRSLVDEYLDRIERLYVADRGETGRELTRLAVLPLGEAMLARDLFALAVAATSLDHRRRLRRRLGVRRARGDRLERVYLARIDLVAFDRRMRAEVPVRDWLLPILARIGRFVPESRRGDRESRARRSAIESGIDRAIDQSGDPEAYVRWCGVFRNWHDLAIDGRLHETPVSVLVAAGEPASD